MKLRCMCKALGVAPLARTTCERLEPRCHASIIRAYATQSAVATTRSGPGRGEEGHRPLDLGHEGLRIRL
jgi:hypothetical protein